MIHPDHADIAARLDAMTVTDPDAPDDPGPLDGPCGDSCICSPSDPCIALEYDADDYDPDYDLDLCGPGNPGAPT